jgi:pilus assembly protein Flp/PilA
MKKVLTRIAKFFSRKKQQGATMVEYGLMVALIAVATIAAVKLLQDGIETVFTKTSTELTNSIP